MDELGNKKNAKNEGFGRRYCVFGIDPGLDGAVAVYDPVVEKLVTVWPMPTDTIIAGRRRYREINIQRLALSLSEAVAEYGCIGAIIEDVHSSPQMGVGSAFKFGDTFGITRALLEVYCPAVHYVSPQRWKNRLGVTGAKIMSIEKARSIFKNSPFFKSASKDGPAEAALIAYYAAKDVIILPTDAVTDPDPLS